jgi:hypothetical protein
LEPRREASRPAVAWMGSGMGSRRPAIAARDGRPNGVLDRLAPQRPVGYRLVCSKPHATQTHDPFTGLLRNRGIRQPVKISLMPTSASEQRRCELSHVRFGRGSATAAKGASAVAMSRIVAATRSAQADAVPRPACRREGVPPRRRTTISGAAVGARGARTKGLGSTVCCRMSEIDGKPTGAFEQLSTK